MGRIIRKKSNKKNKKNKNNNKKSKILYENGEGLEEGKFVLYPKEDMEGSKVIVYDKNNLSKFIEDFKKQKGVGSIRRHKTLKIILWQEKTEKIHIIDFVELTRSIKFLSKFKPHKIEILKEKEALLCTEKFLKGECIKLKEKGKPKIEKVGYEFERKYQNYYFHSYVIGHNTILEVLRKKYEILYKYTGVYLHGLEKKNLNFYKFVEMDKLITLLI